MDTVTLQRIVLNATLFSFVLTVLILASLRFNARLWLQDYPKAMREKVPPLSATERRQRAVLAVLMMGILFGGILLTALDLRAQRGTMPFGIAYLHIFAMLFLFNLVDAVIIDLLIISLLKPRFVILPGTEGMEGLFNDYRKQFIDFLKGLVFCTVASVPFALIAVI